MRNRFRWVDGERTIIFGRGVVADAVEALGGPGYTLLTTARAKDSAPGVVAGAGALHIVRGGQGAQSAPATLEGGGGERRVALGGGRVVEGAKATAAARSAGGGAAAP